MSGRRPILVISGVDPRGPRHGMLMRVELAVEALGELGPVDVAVVRPSADASDGEAGPFPSTIARARVFTFERHLTVAQRIPWFLRPSVPLNVVGRDTTQMSRELAAWMSPDYALVWVVGAAVYQSVESLVTPFPVVVDLNDLESDKLTAQLSSRRASRPTRGVSARVREALAQLQGSRNAAAWRSYEDLVVRRVQRSCVCSEADRATLGSEAVAVVPNSYPTPPRPLGRSTVGDPPTVLLQGSMTYPPNKDAAQFFVRDVLPQLQQRLPGVQVRIVGRADDDTRRLADDRGVTVTGYVPDIDRELERADLVVVPIRYGGGTRIKIIEALAHGIPVVSTRMGAFGLDVADEEHLLLADDARDFAAACVRALTDSALRQHLASSGREHYDQHFRDRTVKARIHEVVMPLLSSVADGGERLPSARP